MSIALEQTDNRLSAMLLVAAALHAFLILTIKFELTDPHQLRPDHNSIEIRLVRQPDQQPKPDEAADLLAQSSQHGEGGLPDVAEIATETLAAAEPTPTQQPIPAPVDPQPVVESNQQPVPEPVVTVKKSLTEVENRRPLSASQLFASKDQEIAHLVAQLERKSLAYSKKPRRRAISASTKEYKYAAYLDAWRRKVERIGNLNYPDEAKRQGLHGNLILHVAIKQDGTIEQVRILKSSGHKLLDDAAKRIVHLAAPFSPFPKNISEETDVLDITRTWRFMNNRLDAD